jgi:hypothetical protein
MPDPGNARPGDAHHVRDNLIAHGRAITASMSARVNLAVTRHDAWADPRVVISGHGRPVDLRARRRPLESGRTRPFDAGPRSVLQLRSCRAFVDGPTNPACPDHCVVWVDGDLLSARHFGVANLDRLDRRSDPR